ncbi:non-homologous end joining protein Ku [Paludibaculum fermentans]|uniref:Non-homologous end joining protein Ku n=1 Tax=Paludibaculum fermentans TaxID=1473598 RepID=A0A7S7SNQ1_PALFE|nr:Ku protein [Paludibaculum fermentans]QOY91148.1 Ku protein [Paludibaculum fermentans]
MAASTVWKGYISFGLVSFPVRLTSAARAERVRFHMLHRKDLSRVKEVWFCAEEDKRIERTDVVKGYELDNGNYIVVEDEELKKIAPPTATTMEILQFVSKDEVDPIFFESSYYVTGEGKAAKPYALFTAALEETNQDAVAKLAMHNREHVVLIRPSEGGLILHTLFYPDELHQTNRSETPKSKYTARELELAKGLIKQMKAPFQSQEFTDGYRANVERLLLEKQKGRKITSIRQPRKAPVIDLMDALRRSLKSGAGKVAAKGHAKPAAHKASGRRKAG